MRLVVATTNAGKLREIRTLLRGVPYEVVALDDWPHLAAPEETGAAFAENARLKALYYAAQTGELTVAEDSGLEIDALGGAPGVQSARYGGHATYAQKFTLIYDALRARGETTSRARFVCALALARDGRIIFETQGIVEGEIAPAPRGERGFGYDPIFFYPPYGRTLGQVSAEQKDAISHRGQAFSALCGFLKAEWAE